MLNPNPVTNQGRRIKFTPERMEQIKNLVERGHKREEIAEIVGVTLGSLQVTCSKFGISLRRLRFDNGVEPNLRQEKPQMMALDIPEIGPPPTNGLKSSFTLTLEYDGRSVLMPLDPAAMTALIMEAEIRGLRVGELLARLIREFVDRKDLPK